MNPALVRLAILVYPRHWRRRDGAELEQLVLAVMTERHSLPRRARILLDLIVHGVGERCRALESTRAKVVLTSAFAVLIGTFAVATGIAPDPLATTNTQLATTVRLGQGVTVQVGGQGGSAGEGQGGSADQGRGQGRIRVVVPAGADPQVDVAGSGSSVVIDSTSGHILSVTRTNAPTSPPS